MSASESRSLGFVSYTQVDDAVLQAIPAFSEKLAEWIGVMTGGRKFTIYCDRADLPIGGFFEQPLREAIEESFFFFAMVSRAYFRNPNTRSELEIALSARERRGAHDYYIIPIYTLEGPEEIYNDSELQNDDLVKRARSISKVYDDDWRESIDLPLDSSAVKPRMRSLAQRLAEHIRNRPPAGKPLSQETSERQPRSDTTGGEDGEIGRTGQRRIIVESNESIQAAIDSAAPGDRIQVREGVYHESLFVDKPLEIIGADASKVTVWESDKDVLTLQTPMAYITGFSFAQTGKKGFGVSIGQGRPELHDCDIKSSGSACLVVHSGANPNVHNNKIHDSAQGGVFVYGGSLGTFEDNEIYNCMYANVEIADGSAPTFRRNNIYEGRSGGVFVRDDGRGVFEHNQIHHNTLSNVAVTRHGAPRFAANFMRNGHGLGINVYFDGGGEFEDNVICWNQQNGIRVSERSSPTFSRNEIRDNNESGAYFTNGATGRLEANHLSGNIQAGVAVDGLSSPEIRWNTIDRNKSQGLYLDNPGDLAVEDNLLIRNHDAGITMTSLIGGVRDNRSAENGTFGLICYAAKSQEAKVKAVADANRLERNFYDKWQRRPPEQRLKGKQGDAEIRKPGSGS
jgi:parallel beta-helix repeat protein